MPDLFTAIFPPDSDPQPAAPSSFVGPKAPPLSSAVEAPLSTELQVMGLGGALGYAEALVDALEIVKDETRSTELHVAGLRISQRLLQLMRTR